jgi:4-hydroxy-2-oxoheptanedioate aldolase
VIETEHNALGPGEIQQMLMAMNGTNTIPTVRVPSSTQRYIQNVLDIMVLLVRSVEEARALVTATRYPPYGMRGFGPLRVTHYNFNRQGCYENANDNTFVMLNIETKEGWEQMD